MLIVDEADDAVNAEIAGDDKTPSPQPEEPGKDKSQQNIASQPIKYRTYPIRRHFIIYQSLIA